VPAVEAGEGIPTAPIGLDASTINQSPRDAPAEGHRAPEQAVADTRKAQLVDHCPVSHRPRPQGLARGGVGCGGGLVADRRLDPARMAAGSSCKLVRPARRSPARQVGEPATEASSYRPLPALRPSWPGGGSCRPG
jgi:hypothetical protein